MNGVLLFLALESISTPFEELRRFPSREVAALNYQFADACVRHLEKELSHVDDGGIVAWVRYDTPLSRHSAERAHLIETLYEARHCRSCWRALALARGDCADRLQHAESLKVLLSDEDFAAGQMPPAFPWWRARRVD